MTDERIVVLSDGAHGIVRPIRPSDREALVDGLMTLTPETRIKRFFFNKKEFSERELDRLTHPDGIDHIAYAMTVKSDEGTKLIGVARCFRDENEKDLAEVAIVTTDEWQGDGVGIELMKSLSEAALEVGISRWFAAMFSANTSMRRLLNHFGKKCEEGAVGAGVVEVIYEIVAPGDVDLASYGNEGFRGM